MKVEDLKGKYLIELSIINGQIFEDGKDLLEILVFNPSLKNKSEKYHLDTSDYKIWFEQNKATNEDYDISEYWDDELFEMVENKILKNESIENNDIFAEYSQMNIAGYLDDVDSWYKNI